MLIESIEWVGERVHIHFFDVDGSHETVILFPSEALDLLGWLIQERDTLLRLNAKQLEQIQRREEHVQ